MAAVGTFLAAAALLTGCGATSGVDGPGDSHANPVSSASSNPALGSTAPGNTTAAPTTLPSDLPRFQVPLAAYELNGANLYTMEEAQIELANQCMSRFGFPAFTPPLNRDQMIAEQKESDARLYGIDSLAEATTYGYAPQVVPGASQADAMPSQSASYEFVFTGNQSGSVAPPPGGWKSPGKFGGLEIPPGGCLGEARTRLWGSPDSHLKDQLAQSVRITAYQQSEADPRVQALFKQWSTCMAQQGYQYQTPLEPKFDRPDGSAPSTAETGTAVADVTCKNKTDLVAQWNQIDIDYQQQAIEKNQLDLTEEKTKIQAALKKAAAVLNGHD